MDQAIVYLFADTNLLLQCRPLEELDWSAWSTFKEVRVIVSSPVLREIDYRKNKGNDRVSNRARAASAMFRAMIGERHKIVRESIPCVTLSVETHHQYSMSVPNKLNYQERDDQLIGIVYEFAQKNPGAAVRLLTHDTTPLYTARGLGLAAEVISNDWLLPPANTDSEREMAALRAENARLKKAEPFFSIRCVDGNDAEADSYEISYTRFDPLTDAEVDGLVRRLRDRFPLETDFGPRDPTEREVKITILSAFSMKEKFSPATMQEITKYCDESYPQWLESCRATLRAYHHTLQRQEPLPALVFLAENRGTRPATDALITVEAKGNFQIMPSRRDDHDRGDEDADSRAKIREKEGGTGLKPPPSAPKGKWRRIDTSFQDLSNGLKMLDDSFLEALSSAGKLHAMERTYALPPIYEPTRRDVNAFYYKRGRPMTPRKFFSLECDQWRHEDGEMEFEAEFHFGKEQDKVEGALVCRIQAGNLSQNTSKLIRVQIAISRVSGFERACDIVARACQRDSR